MWFRLILIGEDLEILEGMIEGLEGLVDREEIEMVVEEVEVEMMINPGGEVDERVVEVMGFVGVGVAVGMWEVLGGAGVVGGRVVVRVVVVLVGVGGLVVEVVLHEEEVIVEIDGN